MQTQELPLDARHGAEVFWLRVAQQASGWLAEQGLAVRDAVLLLPFAQHLTPARRAWIRLGTWQPRIETTHSLAAALGPNYLAAPQQLTFDAAIDAHTAAALLRSQSWAQALKRSDGRAYRLALARLVEAAHALARASYTHAPSQRDAYWAAARAALADASGPGGIERALAMVALEWAAADAQTPPTDALFALQPSAWIYLQAGGPDALSLALLGQSDRPALCLMADVELDGAFADCPPFGRLEQAICADFEDLAQRSAVAVLQHLAAGRAPVALVAQDRVVVRRVRALLARQSVTVLDETGWTLATTPPAAHLMTLLRASAPQASLDEWLSWLKSDLATVLRDRAGDAALPLLEARCRAGGWRKPQSVVVARLAPTSAALWMTADDVLLPLRQGPSRRSLSDWIAALSAALRAVWGETALLKHEAGEKMLGALWISRSPWPGSAHEQVLRDTVVLFSEFIAWVDDALEAEQFVPASGEDAQVVVTPLARAMLRPFAAIVLPGADAQTLGPAYKLPALFSDTQAQALKLPDLQQQRDAVSFAFTQALRAPVVTLLRAAAAGAEPLAASPLLERLDLALRRGGHGGLSIWRDERPEQAVALMPQPRAAAVAAGVLPASLSASSVESLRACPYQFFGRSLLGLRQQDELEAETDKRDYGTWLHAVLHRFHQERLQADEPEDDGARLRRNAAELTAEQQLPAADFLPFSASFERFSPRYLTWLAETEAAGQHYLTGEEPRSLQVFGDPVLAALSLQGRLDRIDSQNTSQHTSQNTSQAGHVLIDYKTGGSIALKQRLARPLEDTQLMVYAALMLDADVPLQARYLALDDAAGITAVAHPNVEHSAVLMIDGLGEDLLSAWAGTPLPALGEGGACDYCEMRGLCRRDDWAEVAL